ncbi:MAG: hypothetical protein LBJ72_14500 [Dysgonamonadaceae bacterium]|jgi:hypothetical protein|nr:hypothetical protein [Dysgonamonadaceae bacterium]
MVIWSGRGIIPVLVFFLFLVVCNFIFPEEHWDYGVVSSLFATGIFCWYFGNKWNNKEQRVLIDEQTGKKFILKNNHSLFWIPVQYWGIICAILGIIVLFQNSIPLALIALIILVSYSVFNVLRNKKDL